MPELTEATQEQKVANPNPGVQVSDPPTQDEESKANKLYDGKGDAPKEPEKGKEPEVKAEPEKEPEKEAKSDDSDKPSEKNETEPEKKEAEKKEAKAFEPKFPKDSPLAKDELERIASYVKDQGLSNEDSQKLLEREHERLVEYVDRQLDAVDARNEVWVDELKSDKEMGGDSFEANAKLAYSAIRQFAPEGFPEQLKKAGLANHPGLVKTFFRIGKAMESDKFEGGVAPTKKAPKSAADLLYDNSQKE